jgi:hypothetical protein
MQCEQLCLAADGAEAAATACTRTNNKPNKMENAAFKYYSNQQPSGTAEHRRSFRSCQYRANTAAKTEYCFLITVITGY